MMANMAPPSERVRFTTPHDYAPRLTAEQWLRCRPLVTKLHHNGVRRPVMMTEIHDKFNYNVTLNQLNFQMRKWGLHVYDKSKQIESPGGESQSPTSSALVLNTAVPRVPHGLGYQPTSPTFVIDGMLQNIQEFQSWAFRTTQTHSQGAFRENHAALKIINDCVQATRQGRLETDAGNRTFFRGFEEDFKESLQSPSMLIVYAMLRCYITFRGHSELVTRYTTKMMKSAFEACLKELDISHPLTNIMRSLASEHQTVEPSWAIALYDCMVRGLTQDPSETALAAVWIIKYGLASQLQAENYNWSAMREYDEIIKENNCDNTLVRFQAPAKIVTQSRLANLYRNEGDHPKAKAMLRNAIEQLENNNEFRYISLYSLSILGLAEEETHDYDKAEEAYWKAFELASVANNAQPWDILITANTFYDFLERRQMEEKKLAFQFQHEEVFAKIKNMDRSLRYKIPGILTLLVPACESLLYDF